MQFLHLNETWAWCAEHGVAVDDERHRPADDPTLLHRYRAQYADGGPSGREAASAEATILALGEWDEALLWITEWGIWPSSEDWPRFYAARGAHGERMSLAEKPGHIFRRNEVGELRGFLTILMQQGWGGWLLLTAKGVLVPLRIVISHDEWLELQAAEPSALQLPAA